MVGVLPQFLMWHMLFGSPMANPYSGQLYWTQPQVWQVLFSPFHGLFIFAPILLFAVVGVFLFAKTDFVLGSRDGDELVVFSLYCRRKPGMVGWCFIRKSIFLNPYSFFCTCLQGVYLTIAGAGCGYLCQAYCGRCLFGYKTLDNTLTLGEYYPLKPWCKMHCIAGETSSSYSFGC